MDRSIAVFMEMSDTMMTRIMTIMIMMTTIVKVTLRVGGHQNQHPSIYREAGVGKRSRCHFPMVIRFLFEGMPWKLMWRRRRDGSTIMVLRQGRMMPAMVMWTYTEIHTETAGESGMMT